MRWSKALLKTMYESPSSAVDEGHKLLLRANMIHQESPGVHSILPLGKKVLDKIEDIVREEMDAIGSQELYMPALVNKALWDETGRYEAYGQNTLRVTDRKGRKFMLAPTHEEVVTDIVRSLVGSYSNLPQILYQIQTKFRDETRPRAGLMRAKEFNMKDAYSFDATSKEMIQSYNMMWEAYEKIFRRIGFDFTSILADSGAIGGNNSVEFVARAKKGDVTYFACDHCDYRANEEKAEGLAGIVQQDRELDMKIIETPGMKTVDELVRGIKRLGYDLSKEMMIKTIIYQTSEPGEPAIAVMVMGDDDINEIKLANAIGVSQVSQAGKDIVRQVTGAPVGFAGPIGLSEEIRLYVDRRAYMAKNVLFGVNQEDRHAINASIERDVDHHPFDVVDVRAARSGDLCTSCEKGHLEKGEGIELGHIFQLGKVYSEPMNATFTRSDGTQEHFWMGCYGIGTTRLMQSAAEQNHDKDGLIWPKEITPYHVIITATDMKNNDIVQASEELYGILLENGFDVLYDDRNIGAGAKFKDADLIGIPLRVNVGKEYLKSGLFELRERETGNVSRDDTNTLLAKIHDFYI